MTWYYYYWVQLPMDLVLVAAAALIPQGVYNHHHQDLSLKGFLVPFSLLYFNILHGWYLYVHHYASRITETSRIQSLLVGCWMVGMVTSVYHAAASTTTTTSTSTGSSPEQLFSTSMIIQRVSIFCMMARVAVYLPRASMFCALLGFFVGDSILCFTFAASAHPIIASYLWGITTVMELGLDFFLLVLTLVVGRGNGGGSSSGTTTTRDRGVPPASSSSSSSSPYISYNLQWTMDRLWILIVAPMGGIIMTVASHMTDDFYNNSNHNNNSLLSCSAVLLPSLFALLYLNLQPAVVDHMNRPTASEWGKAMLLTLIKLLGWALWTTGACLLILLLLEKEEEAGDDDDSHGGVADNDDARLSFVHILLGWSVGISLWLFRALKALGNIGSSSRPPRRLLEDGLLEVVWGLASWAPFLVVYAIPSRRNLDAIAIYLLIVALLNVIESWRNIMESDDDDDHLGNAAALNERSTTTNNSANNDLTVPSERQRLLPATTATNTTEHEVSETQMV
jgi:hypothetical protein